MQWELVAHGASVFAERTSSTHAELHTLQSGLAYSFAVIAERCTRDAKRAEFAPLAAEGPMMAPGAAPPVEDVGNRIVVWDVEGAGGAQLERRPGDDWVEYNARQRNAAWQLATSLVAPQTSPWPHGILTEAGQANRLDGKLSGPRLHIGRLAFISCALSGMHIRGRRILRLGAGTCKL